MVELFRVELALTFSETPISEIPTDDCVVARMRD